MKPLCYAPFIGIYATSYGKYAPCCVSKRLEFDSPDHYWNSKQLANIKQKLLNNNWPDECSVCKKQTELNLYSDRDMYDNFHELYDPSTNNVGPKIFDLRPGNKCNLKCRMCTPLSSSLIKDEVDKHKELEEFYSLTEEDKNTVNLYNFIINKNIIKLKVLGGEPSIDPEVSLILENLISNNKTDIELVITTNSTNYNRKFYSLLEKFKSVTLRFSIDGAGPAYEYIRTNASWKKTSRNVENILSDNKFNKYIISPVLQPYNLPTLTNFLDWTHSLYNNKLNFMVSYCHSADIKTHISVLDDADIKYCVNLIQSWAEDKDPSFLSYINYYYLIKLLEVEHNPEAKKSFIKFNNSLDRIRNTDISSIHPILSQYK